VIFRVIQHYVQACIWQILHIMLMEVSLAAVDESSKYSTQTHIISIHNYTTNLLLYPSNT